MAWIKVPKSFSYQSQGSTAWGHLEYAQEDGVLTGQGLADADRWMVVPIDPRTPWVKPLSINTGRVNAAASQTFPTHALVVRDPDLFLENDFNGNGQPSFASWICPVHFGSYKIRMNPGHRGKYRFYFMPLSSLPGGANQTPTLMPGKNSYGQAVQLKFAPQSLHPSPVGVAFPGKPLFEAHCMEPRVVKVCFNVVEDASGRQSRVKDSDIAVMEFGAEEILSQALVTPVTSSRRVRVAEDLGDPVGYLQRRGATIFEVLEQYKNPDAEVNAFCVRNYSPARPDFGMEADPGRRIFVIADTVPQSATAFARALARIAGVKEKNLLQSTARLELPQVLQINEFATKFGSTPWH